MATTAGNEKHPAVPMPSAAALLGALGAIPFVVITAASLLGFPLPLADPLAALLAYGAVILSFMGGIHWGLAMRAEPRRSQRQPWSRFAVSVVPALMGWSALLMPQRDGFVLLACAFVALLAYDLASVRSGAAPGWYSKLRWPLSAVVVACLAVAGV